MPAWDAETLWVLVLSTGTQSGEVTIFLFSEACVLVAGEGP